MDKIEKPDDSIAIIHPKHGHATCRRDQLDEFKGEGWKPADGASEAEVKAASEAHTKGTAEGKKTRALVEKARADARAEAEAKKAAKK